MMQLASHEEREGRGNERTDGGRWVGDGYGVR